MPHVFTCAPFIHLSPIITCLIANAINRKKFNLNATGHPSELFRVACFRFSHTPK